MLVGHNDRRAILEGDFIEILFVIFSRAGCLRDHERSIKPRIYVAALEVLNLDLTARSIKKRVRMNTTTPTMSPTISSRLADEINRPARGFDLESRTIGRLLKHRLLPARHE